VLLKARRKIPPMPRYRPATYLSESKDILFHHPINDITKMNKFQVGDRVNAVSIDSYATEKGLHNCNYRVREVGYNGMIKVEGLDAWFADTRFKLIEAARKFKPGDKVRCIRKAGMLENGSVYEVLRYSAALFPGDSSPRLFLKGIENQEWYEDRFVLAEQCNTQTNNKPMATDNVFSITESKIREAAACATEDAKALLNKLFPEAFDKRVNVSGAGNIKIDGIVAIEPRQSLTADPDHHLKSFYLSPTYEWKLERDKYNVLVLVPTKK
jgi:hypothetical protein